MNNQLGIILAMSSSACGAVMSVAYKHLGVHVNMLSLAFVDAIATIILFSILSGGISCPTSRKDRWLLSASSICHGLGMLSFFSGLNYLAPYELSFFSRNQAVVAILIGVFLLKEKQKFIGWVGITISCVGSFLIVNHSVTLTSWIGIGWSALFCIFFAFRSYLFKISGISAKTSIVWGNIATLAITLPLIKLSDLSAFSLESLAVVISVSLVATCLGTMLFLRSLQVGDISIVTPFRSFSPYFVLLYCFFFDSIAIFDTTIIGFLLMTASLFCFFDWVALIRFLRKKIRNKLSRVQL